MADDDLSDTSSLSSLSSLSSVPSDDEEPDVQLHKEKGGILKFFHKVPKGAKSATGRASPPPPKRERAPSPPHEYVLADNQDIAFIVMFRNRLTDAFPKSLATFGPQELEHDIVDSVPGERVEHFLCALLKLLLNRQQDVKPGHYNRALEEAVQSNASQWVTIWKENPLAGGKTFASMTPSERLTLLRALILWAMASSKVVHDTIDHAYKGKRNEDDSNVAMSIQPWGSDSDKRRYFLVEGRDDTAFRVYRESNPAGFINRTWRSVAGSIDETRSLIEKLEVGDGGPKAKKLAKRLSEEIPRFEATEEKRRRREYRQMRKDQFKRPDPGFSVYEGRTRGKRIKYTYSDDEDFLTDSTGRRRSGRNSAVAEAAGPTTTASGRQVRAPNRLNADTGTGGGSGGLSTATSVQGDGDVDMGDVSVGPTGRPRRSAAVNHSMNGWAQKKSRRDYDEYDSAEEDNASEPDLGDDEEEDEHVPDDEEDDEDDEEDDEDRDAALDVEDEELEQEQEQEQDARRSAVVKLPVSAVLDKETGKWLKSNSSSSSAGGAIVSKADLLATTETHTTTLSGKTAPSNGDVTMSESAHNSEETAQSPARTADEISVAINTHPAQSDAISAIDGAAANGTKAERETNGVLVDVTATGMSATLSCRGSPEKTLQSTWPVDAVGQGN